MVRRKRGNPADPIARIVGNEHLALSIHRSIALALKRPCVRLTAKNPQKIFEHSLNASIYDIKNDPKGRGALFRRLIEYGPHNPGIPEVSISDGKTILSDPEVGKCIEFIFSHMVNRFKGELAELLALEACSSLVVKLRRENKLPPRTQLYWGETIQERRRIRRRKSDNGAREIFTKGADGLIIEPLASNRKNGRMSLRVHGVIEVKSMIRSQKKILGQIDHHIDRLRGGVNLAGRVWRVAAIPNTGHKLVRIIVMPSTWKLSRKFRLEKTKNGRRMVFPQSQKPPKEIRIHLIETM